MEYLEYIVLGIALFFAGSWTLLLIKRPNSRVRSTIVTVMYWWLAIGLCGFFSVFHLLWFMPLAAFTPMIIMIGSYKFGYQNSVLSIFIKSLLVLGSALAVLLYWS